MSDFLIFGGTTEGRQLAGFCAENRIYACVSVATDYGASLLPQSSYIKILNGRLDSDKIIKLLSEERFLAVIDATHPYAVLATENISLACRETETPYYRLKRESEAVFGTVLSNMEELAAYLDSTEGCILSTLGSKELPFLTAVHDFYERIWLRVLEADGVREYCRSLGFDEKKIIFGKGPFSEEENILHLQKSRADILVTKESGALGGYPQKAEAARKLGAELVTVKRPEETGMVIGEIKKMILIRKKK